MDLKEVEDTLKAAKKYMVTLQRLESEIESAEKQITVTALETEKNIVNTFAKVLENLTQALNERRAKLTSNVQKIKRDGLQPLIDSQRLISQKMEVARRIINISDCILNGFAYNVNEYTDQSALLGSLPEVPELREVPYITFQYEQNVATHIEKMCSEFGTVSPIAPVQISKMIERPGAILVQWENIEIEDRIAEIQEYRLQKADGNVILNNEYVSQFVDCYIGTDIEFLVKDVPINRQYSFRVCCKFEGYMNWSPWSLPQVAETTIKAYSWAQHPKFFMFDDNRIAVSTDNKPHVIYSDGPQYQIDYTIEFTLLEIGSEDFCFGLIYDDCPSKIDDLQSDPSHSFLINRYGSIFVDGVQKSTHLPELYRGAKVGFNGEMVNDKIWMNVVSSDKILTYEWLIPKRSKLYFAAAIKSLNVKILVE